MVHTHTQIASYISISIQSKQVHTKLTNHKSQVTNDNKKEGQSETLKIEHRLNVNDYKLHVSRKL